MKNNPIIIINGEPNSIFLEILIKSLKSKSYKSPIILISSLKLFKFYMKKFNFKKRINIINYENLGNVNLSVKDINFINVKVNLSNNFKKITNKSNIFIKNSFEIGLKVMKTLKTTKFINGPIDKKYFLNKKYFGVTEYIAKNTNAKKFAMLIYNKKLSVCPLTTHVPIKKVTKYITQRSIKEKTKLINNFYIKYRKIKPRIGVLGLNPHCESTDKYNEDDKILKPAIKSLKQLGYKISGPYSADTMFIRKNRVNFDVIIGMYHDQVLSPIKAINGFDAINITLGLPYIRISPDHGPNFHMIGKNSSNPRSLINAIKFLD